MCAYAAVVPALAQGERYYIRMTLCKDWCLERHVQTAPDVNEVSCKMGAFMTAQNWAMNNFPGWRVDGATCVTGVRQET